MTDQPKSEINIRMPYLKLIEDGTKTVEVRVGYPRMRRIKVRTPARSMGTGREPR